MLTKQEQVYGNSYINYCVSKRMFQELITFAFADDEGKRKTLKEYLTKTIKPVTDNDLAAYTEKVATLTTDKTAIDTYIK